MSATYSKSVFLHAQVRRALQSGRYVPGERIDPATLAAQFNISSTPVRFALYRLVGEGLLEDHGRSGLRVPLPTEVVLRDLYGWMERLLLIACDIGISPMARPERELDPASPGADVVKLTWQLFDAIAAATDQRFLHLALKQANDRLAPIRRAKQDLLDDPSEELSRLHRHWQARDMPALASALRAYHARRKQLVPCIVATLTERRDRLD